MLSAVVDIPDTQNHTDEKMRRKRLRGKGGKYRSSTSVAEESVPQNGSGDERPPVQKRARHVLGRVSRRRAVSAQHSRRKRNREEPITKLGENLRQRLGAALQEAAADKEHDDDDDINGEPLSQGDEAEPHAQVVSQKDLETQVYDGSLDTQAYIDPYLDLQDQETEGDDDTDDNLDDQQLQDILERLSEASTSCTLGSNHNLDDDFDLALQAPDSEEALITYTDQLARQMILNEKNDSDIPEEELTKKQLAMKHFMEGNDPWNSRSSVGQQFRLEEGQKPEWKACVTPEEIEMYRKTWTAKTLDHQTNEKVHSKSFRRIDTTNGEVYSTRESRGE